MNKKHILHYLHYDGQVDEKTNQLIDECIIEVQEFSQFKAVFQKMTLGHDPFIIKEIHLQCASKDLEFYLQNCHECLIICGTLGIQIDQKIKYYQHIDLTKAIVFDAVSNCYLEECLDSFEQTLSLGKRTFRMAPGYGDIPLEMNKLLSRVLHIEKIGVSINKDGLLIPMKSILGIIGLGETNKKSCMSCVRYNDCSLRKGGMTCYVKD
jgi:Vitamin B12 dependent methionine synthase, activation domain.